MCVHACMCVGYTPFLLQLQQLLKIIKKKNQFKAELNKHSSVSLCLDFSQLEIISFYRKTKLSLVYRIAIFVAVVVVVLVVVVVVVAVVVAVVAAAAAALLLASLLLCGCCCGSWAAGGRADCDPHRAVACT